MRLRFMVAVLLGLELDGANIALPSPFLTDLVPFGAERIVPCIPTELIFRPKVFAAANARREPGKPVMPYDPFSRATPGPTPPAHA
jgi:hypothetical protein